MSWSALHRVQDFLGCRILLENVSSYVEFSDAQLTESEFLAEIANCCDWASCSTSTMSMSARSTMASIRCTIWRRFWRTVRQIHLAGHSTVVITSSTPTTHR